MSADMQALQMNGMLELASRQLATRDFLTFILYTKKNFIINWHHRVLAGKLQAFAEGKIKKLMIFLPPQVGKSEMSTRRLPAYILGRDPDKRIAVCAYNQTFASQFNRDIQRIITDQPYRNVFSDTLLNEKNVVRNSHGSYVRNSEIFEVVGKKGFLKTVGIGGPLTGTSVDIGIIDDPIKDAAEANSTAFRDNNWDWYNSVFLTRQHNDSQQLITLTRWHDDDLAGRILKTEADWDVVILPAIREDLTSNLDTREIGQALWPERHSLERMLEIKKKRPFIFSSLYQQRPYFNAEEGRFAWAFSREKHVGKCTWTPYQFTYLSFDFNRNPICCTAFQHYNDTIHVIRCIKLKNSNIYELLNEVKRFFPGATFIVTGDATGQNSSAMVEDNLNYYIIIQGVLRLNDGAFKLNNVNPRIESNQVLLNALLQNYSWVIDEENALSVILDMEYVKMLPDGTIDKSNRNDPTKQADALDTVRYYCDQFFKWYLNVDPSSGIPARQPVAAPEIAAASRQAIYAIETGSFVTCSRPEYIASVRQDLLAQLQMWVGLNKPALVEAGIDEIKRLDNMLNFLGQ